MYGWQQHGAGETGDVLPPKPGIWASLGGSQLPYAEVSAPLGAQSYPSTKEEMWWGEYVDLFSL